MIPFGSSEGIERERSGGFRYFTEHFLTFYDQLIGLISFSAEEA